MVLSGKRAGSCASVSAWKAEASQWENFLCSAVLRFLGKFVSCPGLRICVAPLSQRQPAWLGWLLASDSASYYRSCYAVLGGATTLGISLQSRRNYSSFSLLRNLPVSQLSDLTAGVRQKKGCRTFLPLCIVLGPLWQCAPKKCNAVLLDMGDKLRL